MSSLDKCLFRSSAHFLIRSEERRVGKECSLFSTQFPEFIVCIHFEEGHSDQGEVISHCSFDLHFSNNDRC